MLWPELRRGELAQRFLVSCTPTVYPIYICHIMAARIVAVNAPGTLAQGFGGEPTAFEICLIVKIGDSEEWSVLEAFDEGRSGTGSSGSVLYKKEAGAARSGGRRCHSLPIAQRGGGTRGSV